MSTAPKCVLQKLNVQRLARGPNAAHGHISKMASVSKKWKVDFKGRRFQNKNLDREIAKQKHHPKKWCY